MMHEVDHRLGTQHLPTIADGERGSRSISSDHNAGGRQLRLAFASSPGGHLAELDAITKGLEPVDCFLVTVKSVQTESEMSGVRKIFITRIERNPTNLLLNAAQALRILVRERPSAVISTGAGEAVPLILLASALGIPILFAESVARVHGPSLSGRIVKHWVDLIIAPWPSLRAFYPTAVCVAPLLPAPLPGHDLPRNPHIVLLTGTGPRGFDRLVRGVDQLIGNGRLSGRVYAQIGSSTYTPQNCSYDRFVPHRKLVDEIQRADLVITHCGAGSIREALSAGKPTVVVPRDPARRELLYRGSSELARHLGSMGWLTVVDDPAQIPWAIENAKGAVPKVQIAPQPPASQIVQEFINSVRNEE